MSKYIISSTGTASLNLSASDAALFVLTSECLAKFYKMDCPVETEDSQDEYRFDEDLFCLLVEKVFADQRTWSYHWAHVASGLYEMVKGELYDWNWREEKEPRIPFLPWRWTFDSPDKHSGKTIG